MKWIKQRISEPSTHAALGVLVAVAAHYLPAHSSTIFAIAGIFGVGGFVLSEKN